MVRAVFVEYTSRQPAERGTQTFTLRCHAGNICKTLVLCLRNCQKWDYVNCSKVIRFGIKQFLATKN